MMQAAIKRHSVVKRIVPSLNLKQDGSNKVGRLEITTVLPDVSTPQVHDCDIQNRKTQVYGSVLRNYVDEKKAPAAYATGAVLFECCEC